MPATYTDRLQGLTTSVAVKAPCRVATVGAITLSGLQTVDGVVLAESDRVLVKDQVSASANGIWVVFAGTWYRAADFDGSRDAVGGTQVSVLEGDANRNTYWRVSGEGSVTIGSDSIQWEATLITNASTLSFRQAGATAIDRSVQERLRERVSVQDWGAYPTNVDCSAAIQRAFDEAPLGCDLIFPAPPTPDYEYRCTSPLVLSRKMNLVGPGARLVFRFSGASTSDGLHINPTDGFDLDARNWYIEGFREIALYSGEGNALRVSNDGANVAQIGWVIRNCVITTVDGTAGYAIKLDDDIGYGTHLAHILECQIGNGIYHTAADGITIERCNIFGLKPAITLDLTAGAYQTRIINNTLVARDGALLVLNGDQIYFLGNHCEQFALYGANQGTKKAQLTINGQTLALPARDIFIEHNNFGGGGNCEASIVFDGNVRDVVIDRNVIRQGTLNAVNKDIRLLAGTVKGTVLGPLNSWRGVRTSPDPGFAGAVEDSGVATRGLWAAFPATFANSWTAGTGLKRMVGHDSIVRFEGHLIAGSITANHIIATLPEGYKPREDMTFSCPIENAAGSAWATCVLYVNTSGEIRVRSGITDIGSKVGLGGMSYRSLVRDAYEPGNF